MNKIVEDVFKIRMDFEDIIERYGVIDAYSQGKYEKKSLNNSSRNMGKNDLWIAATASVYDLVLLTTDKDFEHLDGEFIKLECINLQDYIKKKGNY